MDTSDHSPSVQPVTAPSLAVRRDERVNRLALSIQYKLSSGDLAELRKLNPERPPSAFWKLLVTHFDQGEISAESDDERRWAVIIAGMAQMQELHRPGCPTGRIMAEHLHPQRFLRLLRMHDRALHHAVGVTARHLAAKGAAIDWSDLAWLVLSDGRDDEEIARRALAREYYAVQQKRND